MEFAPFLFQMLEYHDVIVEQNLRQGNSAQKLAEAQGRAAEVRSRHPEMQVRRKHWIDLLKEA